MYIKCSQRTQLTAVFYFISEKYFVKTGFTCSISLNFVQMFRMFKLLSLWLRPMFKFLPQKTDKQKYTQMHKPKSAYIFMYITTEFHSRDMKMNTTTSIPCARGTFTTISVMVLDFMTVRVRILSICDFVCDIFDALLDPGLVLIQFSLPLI